MISHGIHRPSLWLGGKAETVQGKERLPLWPRPCGRSAADLVLLNGKVFVPAGDDGRFAQAVAISGDRILAVGTSHEIAALADARTTRLELNGRLVIPGINDAHFHHTPDPWAVRLDLSSPEPSWEEVQDRLAEAVEHAPAGAWILGVHGVGVVNDSRAMRFALDRIAPNHPVRLSAYFGHGSIINSRAMAAIAMSDEEPDPVGGCCERVAGTRRITGKLFGYAQWPHFRHLAHSATIAEAVSDTRRLAREALRFGITSMQTMSFMESDTYVDILRCADTPLRTRVIRFSAPEPGDRRFNGSRGAPGRVWETSRINVSGTKWLLDGTPLERRAALRTDYRDLQGWCGQLYLGEDDMRAMLRTSVESDDQLLVHAAGDRSAELFLNAMESEANCASWRNRRVRIEHGDGLLPDLVGRAADLGVVVVQNPTHFALREILVERHGNAFAYQPARSLIDAGIPFALGSDGPLNPFLNIMFAATHPTRPSEAISVDQALDAYTLGSAFAEFQERHKGTIAGGKLADLAVLSRDIFSMPLDELPSTESIMTIIGGNIAYDAGVLAVPV